MSNRHQKSSRTRCLFGHQHLPVKAGLKVTFVLPSALALRLIWQIVGLIVEGLFPTVISLSSPFAYAVACSHVKLLSAATGRLGLSSSFHRLLPHLLYLGQSLAIQSRFCYM